MNKENTKTKQEVKINLGGLDGEAIYKATGKVARAQHNADRHTELNGKTVKEALITRQVNAQDIKYDIAKGFITLVSYPPRGTGSGKPLPRPRTTYHIIYTHDQEPKIFYPPPPLLR